MKIFEYIPQLGSGGAERFTVDLCNELSERHDVILCTSFPLKMYGFYKDEISSKVKIICLEKKKPGFDWRIPFRLLNILKKEKPDIVHTHLMSIVYTILSVIVYRKPKYFHTVHNSAKEETDGRIGEKVRRFLFRKKLVTPITISPDSHNSFSKFYGLEATQIPNGRNIPSSIDISPVIVEEYAKFRQNNNTKVILQLARISPQKRQDIMARVADRLIKEGYNIEVLMIGDKHDRQIIENVESLKNPHIHMLGSRHNPLEYLKMSDAFALTSSFEGLPISLIEAIGVGTIPICTPVGGITNIIKDGINGFLSTDIEENSYYDALKRFMDTPNETLQKIKEAAMESYMPYSMRECAKKYEQVFNF